MNRETRKGLEELVMFFVYAFFVCVLIAVGTAFAGALRSVLR